MLSGCLRAADIVQPAARGEAMTPVELALAVVWGVLFAVFACERWKTPRKELMKDDDSY
jgi:hypothetical protein